MSDHADYRDMEPSQNIETLLTIMERLRDKETGCEWDIRQTFATIAPYTVEEAYEVKDAIDRDDMADLCDELGDLLLQVAYHAQIASERGAFQFGDVVEAVTKKMLRRHPHVFGTEEQRRNGLRPGDWERIKAKEKAEKRAKHSGPVNKPSSLLDDVANALPALNRAVKLQKRASIVGFDWNDVNLVFDKLDEEIGELKAEIDGQTPSPKAEEELGDLLFVIANIARHLKIDPEQALDKTNAKFVRRFQFIESKAAQSEKSLDDFSLAEMEAFWIESKSF